MPQLLDHCSNGHDLLREVCLDRAELLHQPDACGKLTSGDELK
jgi:hypothetical protein